MNMYHLERVIGKGSEGIVYSATHESHPGRRFAVKRITLPPADHRESRVIVAQRVMSGSECQRYMSTRSSHTVKVHDVILTDPCAYIVQDLMEEGDLCRNTSLSMPELKHVLYMLARGLKDCHDNGICYGDVKPENVGLTRNAMSGLTEPKLFDYGSSIDCFSPTKGCRLRHGTLIFSAPEVIAQKEHGYNADVFGYAVLAYALLSDQQFPWPALHFRAWEDSFMTQYMEVPDMKHLQDDDAEYILRKAMSCKPIDRPSFRQILDVLAHWRLNPQP